MKAKAGASTTEEKSLLLEFLGDTPRFRIIDFLLGGRINDFTKKEIADGAKVSWGSLFKYWPELEKRGIVKQTRKVGHITLYQLDEKNPIVRKIKAIEWYLMERAADEAVENEKIKMVARAR